METPMNKWMIWGAHPYFWKHPYGESLFYNHANPDLHVAGRREVDYRRFLRRFDVAVNKEKWVAFLQL